MKSVHLSFVLVALAAIISCKDKTPTTSDKPSDKPADKPSDKPADKPSDKPADKPSDKPADSWTTYTSKEGKYTIEFPTPPKEKGQGGTTLVLSEFGATDADSRTSGCGIATSPVPNKDAQPGTMLDAMATGYKTDAKVLEDKNITIGKHPGKSLVIENSKHRKWIRLYVIDNKLYINNCGGPFDRGDKDAPTAIRVLDSFKPS